MCNRFVELIALGRELRVTAESRGAGVAEAYFLVHEVLAPALRDPDALPGEDVRDHLAAKLERKLVEREPAYA